jgi:hexosaminidase
MKQVLAVFVVLGGMTQMCIGQNALSSTLFHNTLMPEPASLSVQDGQFVVQPGLVAETDSFHDQRLDSAIDRTLDRMKSQTGILVSRVADNRTAGAVIRITVDGPGEVVQSVTENESYTLTVTTSSVRLHAATDVGAIRGLETLLQLIQNDGSRYFLPAVTITDQPRFRWRGLMIDCSRHFGPVDVLKRTLDGMAAVKLNVFHWHLTDNQGVRIESKIFPRLTEMGSDGLYYTQDQAREIVQYARDRGIRVVPEFDIPGHSSAWFVGYPEIASGSGPYHIEREFGIFDPTMDPTRESTYRFLDKFIGEMATIFPDAYMHIGGDENHGNEWKANPRIQHFMREHHLKDTAALQGYFNERLLKILQKHDKKMIGWDEILSPDLPKDIVVQSWRGFDSLAAGAREGYQGILSAGYYLDHMDTAAQHYMADPIPVDSTLTAEERARILGGEACMWGEYVDQNNIDSRLWPRSAAIAERLWSPQSVNNVDDMYRRLQVESLRLEALGLTHISQEDESLRQLAGTQQIGALETLASALEPVIFDVRGSYSEKHGINQLTPLDHFVDALPPDPPSRHNFEMLVRGYMAAPGMKTEQAAQLTATFESWIAVEPQVMDLMAQSPLLAEAIHRPAQLAQLGRLGMQTLSYLSSGESAPAGWKAAQLELLQQIARPEALTRFDVLVPLRRMVEAVPEAVPAATP